MTLRPGGVASARRYRRNAGMRNEGASCSGASCRLPRGRCTRAAYSLLDRAFMARPLRTDWFTWFTSLPASTLLVVCLFVPQFSDCNGHDKDAFDTSTAPMMIALAIIGVLPLLWRWLPNAGEYEDLA